ncbi:hypothetical protein CCR75_005038 [Bremia lactucae]|uniref:Uncharacterized protein n=1 Tax=Bremia lactucae TaxID=4779 RepID=A0A976IEX4_BRELC|nr:hypothetical protein CCR75_005038 [Bremia lactucae]
MESVPSAQMTRSLRVDENRNGGQLVSDAKTIMTKVKFPKKAFENLTMKIKHNPLYPAKHIN